ncbi:hypothetical protein CF386_07205 [Paraphotobacterium marinum]|uniref:2'-5' RNA ligase n=1 Tax=Paraphotobacterium marinum TaxID=1755811 RepID=A0A220VEZ3_9GAMM|nr:hypothetical protein [Paraphotobacterium marinum]ASK78796.1 hypothetical protein CF386_07205 [Paraphotobacterium marinum]
MNLKYFFLLTICALSLSLFAKDPVSKQKFCNEYNETPQYDIFLIVPNKLQKTAKIFDEKSRKYTMSKNKGHYIHVTLYLAHFQPNRIEDIQDTLKIISKSVSKKDISIEINKSTTSFSGAFLMLNLKNNVTLQALSDKVTAKFFAMRDQRATIPCWAKDRKNAINLFKDFGTPTGFLSYKPHITLLSPSDFLNVKISNRLKEQLNGVIEKTYFKLPKKLSAVGIGIAEVNNDGQIYKSDPTSKIIKLFYFKNHTVKK